MFVLYLFNCRLIIYSSDICKGIQLDPKCDTLITLSRLTLGLLLLTWLLWLTTIEIPSVSVAMKSLGWTLVDTGHQRSFQGLIKLWSFVRTGSHQSPVLPTSG